MLTHCDIWNAIDRLACERGLTASGLARRAGLDATTFNKSKRITREGKPRWPNTESISKVLEATGATLAEFLALMPNGSAVEPRTLPLLAGNAVLPDCLSQLSRAETTITFPESTEQLFAFAARGADMAPYRDGDILIASMSAAIRNGDRLLIRLGHGRLLVAEFIRRTNRRLWYRRLGAAAPEAVVLSLDEVSWLARILWASQ